MGTPSARVGDEIAHSNAMSGLLMGAALGCVLAVAIVATGGLAAVAAGAMIAGGVAGGALAGEYVGGASMGPPTGAIVIGSPDVFINFKPAAMATMSMAPCVKEYGVPQPVAMGAATVFINGMPAARKGDKLTCGAIIIGGSSDVFVDDRTKQVLAVAPEVPPWLNTTLQVVAVGAAVVGFGAAIAAVGFGVACAGLAGSLIGGWAGGEAGHALGKALGLSESATRTLEVIGGLGGGIAGGAGATSAYEGFGRNPLGEATPSSDEVCTGGCPISLHTGEELLAREDFVWGGPLALRWTRFYRTAQSDTDLQLGHGWLTPVDEWIELDADGGLQFHDREGRRIALPLPAIGQQGVNIAERMRVHRSAQHLRICAPSTPDRLFMLGAGRRPLLAWRNASGHQIDIVRDDLGQATALRASWGRSLVIERDGHRIRQVTPARRTARGLEASGAPLVRYAYDADGDLVGALDRLDQGERYAYAGHLLTRRTLATGFSFHFEWDASGPGARCVRNWGDRGIYDYRFEWDRSRGWSRMTDSLGGVTDYVHDGGGRLRRTTSPEGITDVFRYDARGQLVEVGGVFGAVARYGYDGDGQLVEATDAAGASHRLAYDLQGRLVEVIDPLGNARRWTYDDEGRLIATTDALGGVTAYTYNAQGLLAQVRNAVGQVRVLWWDAHARLVAELGFDGIRRRFTHDADDRIASVTAQERRVRRYDWDPVGRLRAFGDDAGIQVRLRHDARGQLTHWTAADGSTVEYRYREGLAQPSERIDPLGRTLRYHYDSERRLVGLTNANGDETTFARDKDGRLVEQVGFDGRVQRYRYDAAGRLVGKAEAATIAADGQVGWALTRLQRDAVGRLTAKETDDGQVARFGYDLLGRLVQASTADHVVGFGYDALGRIVEDIQGDATLAHEVDAVGRRTSTRLPDGQTLRFAWNERGRLDEITLDHRPLSRHEWNDFAQEAQRQQGDVTTRYDYDPAGRLKAQAASVDGSDRVLIGRDYDRDVAGRIKAIHDLREGDTRYVYDPAGQLLDVQGLTPERFVHDPAGNLLIDGEARVDGDRLLMQGDRHFRYDAAGNRIEERRGTGGALVTHYEYDASNRLQAVRGPKGTSRYRYDALGRRIAKSTPQGETRFVWDGARMIGEATADVVPASTSTPLAANDLPTWTQRWYVYEPGTFRPLARIERVPPGAAARLSLVPPSGQAAAAPGEAEVFYYHLDHLGTPREMTDARGRIVWSARYRAWGALAVADVHEIDNPLRFQGQYQDVETGLHYNLNRYYDPVVGRFINQDPIGLAGGPNPYRYVGNPTGWTDPLGLSPIEWVDPNSINFSQRTIADNNYAELMNANQWDWERTESALRVMDVDGQLVTYDNRRLDAALESNTDQVPIQRVNPDDPFPDSTTGKTWSEKFQQRFSDPRNKRAGGTVPDEGISERPTKVCKT